MKNKPTPQRVNVSTSLCHLLALVLLVFCAISPQAYALDNGETPSEVQDLRYGVVLYHYYQQSYFDALTESLIGEEKVDIPFHGDSAKLLRGGMSLSYGMAEKAESIFNELLDSLGKPEQKNRAWFYLGKLHYLREDRAEAEAAFSQIEGLTLEPELAEELIYLQSSLLLRNDQLAEADANIQLLPETSPWLSYYYFNRGAAQTVAGNWELGVQSFQLMEGLPLKDNEGLILKDRAYIASGFAYLGAGVYDKAIDNFINVRLDSPLADKAMLGYGWAAAQQEDFDKALAPWQALSKKSVLKPSVQESLLAIPYAYEKIDAPASALSEYLQASEVFEQELSNIQAAITLFTNAPMSEIMSESTSLGSDWISGEDYLPLNKQAPYLSHLISQDHFQTAISDHNDLIRMSNFLSESTQKYEALNGVLGLQKKVWKESLEGALREKYRERYEDLLVLQKDMLDTMALAEQEGDGRRLVSPEDEALWRKAEQAAKRIKLLEAADYDVSDERESLRLFQGLLTWRATEEFPIKKWEYAKQITEIESMVKDTQDKLVRLEALSADRYDVAFSNRMVEMGSRIDQQSRRVNQALAQSEVAIRQLAIDELTKQKKRLSYYLGRARLAIARLYDAGSAEAEQ